MSKGIRWIGVVTGVVCTVAVGAAHAQQCGDPPRVDNQSLKAELEGKAKFLSSLVGVGLRGQIDIARTDIFGKYPDATQAHSDTYLLYMFCTFVVADSTLTAQERLQFLEEFNQTIKKPLTKTVGDLGYAGSDSVVVRDYTKEPPDAGKTLEKATQDAGKTVEKAAQDAGKTIDKATHDTAARTSVERFRAPSSRHAGKIAASRTERVREHRERDRGDLLARAARRRRRPIRLAPSRRSVF
jgi:hypothetical protein